MAKQSVQFTDTKRVKDLVALMAENGLTEIELVEDKSKIILRRGPVQVAAPIAAAPSPVAAAAPAVTTVTTVTAPAAAPAVDAGLVPIKSPMVGTFYSATNPESEPYVSVGSAVGEDTVVCIIEAMKVFNEIRAETTGSIAKILVQNGQTVEFGQPLFLVKPN